MLTWYQDKVLKILFDREPDTDIRKIEPTATKEEIEDIKKKPLILNNTVFCRINYKGHSYGFMIHKGYTWDGATIPAWAWAIIGSKLDPQFTVASLIHDNLCEHHDYIGNNCYLSTTVFCSLLKEAGVGNAKRFLMFHSVYTYQRLRGGWN